MTNVKNRTKTILFASLIVAMILPFSTMDFAEAKYSDDNQTEKYTSQEVIDAIQQISPYVVLDEDGYAIFNIDKNTISVNAKTIKIIEDYIELQTSYRQQATNDPNSKPNINEELKEKFSDFKEEIKKQKKKSSVQKTSSLSDWILPKAFAWGEICGGAPWNTQPEPSVERKISSGNAHTYLVNGGYHQPAFYATGLGHHGNDYSKKVSAFGCDGGEMRSQGLVTGYNTYNSQTPEPNPELHTYTAPVWWWDGYVIQWHIEN